MGTLSLTLGLLTAFLFFCAGTAQDTFNLYAYGENIGGLSLLFRDGYAQIGDPGALNSSFEQIYFSSNSSSSQFIANPNTTANSANATWSNEMLYVPDSSSTDSRVGFSSNPGSNVTTTFRTYGQFIFVVNSSTSEWESDFYVQSTGTTNLYSLLWNPDDSADYISVSLRTTAPSNFQAVDNSTSST